MVNRLNLKLSSQATDSHKTLLYIYCIIYIYNIIYIYTIYIYNMYIQYIYIYTIYMIWYDMIWYDMIWYDMIWYDMIYYNIYKNPLRCWTIFSPLNCGDGICEIAGATILGAGGRVLQCVAFCVTQEDGIRESQQRNGQLKKKVMERQVSTLSTLSTFHTKVRWF